MKSIALVACSFFILSKASAQQNNPGTATAVATANIVTEMVGAYAFEEMKFEDININKVGIKANSDNIVNGTASFNIIGNYEYAVTVPDKDILLTREGSTETIQVGSFSVSLDKDELNKEEQKIIINADLNVNAVQSAGNYSSETPLVVTVNYN